VTAGRHADDVPAHDAQHRPPAPDAGDESTVGGYAAVHGRPAAFEAVDGFSYSVEMCADATGERGAAAWGGYFLFLRWRRLGAQGVEGHLESDFVTRAASEVEALDALGRVSLRIARATLDTLVRTQPGGAPPRRWWTVAAADDDDAVTPDDAAGDDAPDDTADAWRDDPRTGDVRR
jgi:hypothetical protein